MIQSDRFALGGRDDDLPDLALMMIGKALSESYSDLIRQPLPERLARIIREIEARERGPGGDHDGL